MKHNWEYKRLGSFLKTTSGGTPLKGVSEYYDGGTIPWLRSGEVCQKEISDCEIYITQKAIDESSAKFVPANSVVIAMYGATAGQVGIIRRTMTTNQAICSIFPSSYYNQDFLYYYLSSAKGKLVEQAYGAAQPNISQAIIKALNIPVPPMVVQEHIVAELDKINETIEDCRELLRNLDALAQSLFYDFFGDPITNSKGWEIKPLKDAVIEMFLGPFGSALKTDCYVPEEDSFAMVYEQKHAIKKTLKQENNFINEDKFFALKRFEVLPFDFIMSCRGTIGQLYQVPENAPRGIIHPSVMKIRLNSSTYGSVFFKFLLPIIIKEQQTKGNCVQMAITAKELGAKKLPVPPLELQEKFAERIEQIEAQKKTVENTIAELQTLLDSRMDYWFN
ncbi:MAG: restriction endonuclease subunit S [Muribaculaceae bacterium]